MPPKGAAIVSTAETRALFDQIDVKGAGLLTPQQIALGLGEVGYSDGEVEAFLLALDTDGDDDTAIVGAVLGQTTASSGQRRDTDEDRCHNHISFGRFYEALCELRGNTLQRQYMRDLRAHERWWARSPLSSSRTPLRLRPILTRQQGQTAAVRLYVSSVLPDARAEHRLFQRGVLPGLRQQAREARIQLFVVELRSGRAEADDASTLLGSIHEALRELSRCEQEAAGAPFFLGFITERTGPLLARAFDDIADDDVNHADVRQAMQPYWPLSLQGMEVAHGVFRLGNPNALFTIRMPTGAGPEHAAPGEAQRTDHVWDATMALYRRHTMREAHVDVMRRRVLST